MLSCVWSCSVLCLSGTLMLSWQYPFSSAQWLQCSQACGVRVVYGWCTSGVRVVCVVYGWCTGGVRVARACECAGHRTVHEFKFRARLPFTHLSLRLLAAAAPSAAPAENHDPLLLSQEDPSSAPANVLQSAKMFSGHSALRLQETIASRRASHLATVHNTGLGQHSKEPPAGLGRRPPRAILRKARPGKSVWSVRSVDQPT